MPDHINRLAQQIKSGTYRVDDVKRVYIPKSHGKTHPLALPTVADKVVQKSVADLLNSIWEEDFLPNNHGYRRSKSAHQVVHSLQLNLQFKGYGYIVEADIKGFFDKMDHVWLSTFTMPWICGLRKRSSPS